MSGNQYAGYSDLTCIPVTLKYAREIITKRQSTVFGASVHNFSVIGAMRGKYEEESSYIVGVEDGTAFLSIVLPITYDETEMPLQPGNWYRFIGTLRDECLYADHLKVVASPNEIISHFLECASLYKSHFEGGSMSTGMQPVTSQMRTTASSMQGQTAAAATADSEKRVLTYLQQKNDSNGISAHELVRELGLTMAEITRLGDQLESQGEIWINRDDDTVEFFPL
ncbi:hypothetical protein PCE1_004778 [Barthelona sp. PCE]